MSNRGFLNIGASVGFLLLVLSSVFPDPARAAWVTGTAFTVGGSNLRPPITPNLVGTTGFLDPTCGLLGGTSLALVPGLKLAALDPVRYPVPPAVVLVVSCLDSLDPAIRSRLNFIDPANGTVIKQISTSLLGGSPTTTPFAPGNGWAHLIHRPDKGDLLGCATDGSLYRIDFSQVPTPTDDGKATQIPRPVGAPTACTGLAWDGEAEMIYQVAGNQVVRFKDDGSQPGNFTVPCAANGLAISGGVLLLSCDGAGAAMQRVDKNTGIRLGVHGTLLSAVSGLGGLACDPVTFHKDPSGRDLFTDALWSRRSGNSVVALEFPAFTCGMPSKSVVLQGGVPFSPLAAGLSAGTQVQPGLVPLAACFDGNGRVKDEDRDGLPDCWEGAGNGIDFSGRGARDVQLCVFADTNGDGIPDETTSSLTACADPTHKDLFVEIDYMQHHKPDPKALSQTQSVASVGVKSVREAFAAAPVQTTITSPPSTSNGIRIHFQVDEQVTFIPFGESAPTSHVDRVAFTPCTAPASAGVDLALGIKAVDFDVVKAANFGTFTERGDANSANILNAKRLAFRYVLFAHNLVGNPNGGSSGSGCAEVGGDDAVITLGSFAATTVDGVSHPRGTTDQQAGTFMHELGHTLGLRHGGSDGNNCKPNYRSVMSYTRQFSGSPIVNRRLDYSRSKDPVLSLPTTPNVTGVLNENSLNERDALGSDPSLGPIPIYFPLAADQIAYGPNAWSLVAANAGDINWNRNFQGKDPKFELDNLPPSININLGATTGCDGVGTDLVGHDDWSNILYRSSAAIDFAGARSNDDPVEMTSGQEEAFFLAKDADGNGAGDGTDCGSFLCTHRIDIKPSFPIPKTIDPGDGATVITIAIFSETNGSQPPWDASTQVVINDLLNYPLKFSVESFEALVKINNKSQGTCSIQDVEPPEAGSKKDGIKDLKCQFPTVVDGLRLPAGTHYGVVSGFFRVDKSDLKNEGEIRAFTARQLVTIIN